MTYSIVARDPETGQLGVAVQTCMFGVGTIVPWAIAGVGAVATQAMAEPAYGPRCLDAMGAGASATAALSAARQADPAEVIRQVGVVDANGGAAAFSGDLTIEHAGHEVGDGWTVQANMMASPRVWPAMAETYQASTGAFGQRLLAALRAGEAEGGDARGQMSAALLIVDGQRHPEPWLGRLVDIRIDHNIDDPLAELERLYRAALAYQGFNKAVEALTAGDAERALEETDAGLDRLPGDENLRFVRVGALMAAGDIGGGMNELHGLLSARPSWATVMRSFADRGFMNVPEGIDIATMFGDAP